MILKLLMTFDKMSSKCTLPSVSSGITLENLPNRLKKLKDLGKKLNILWSDDFFFFEGKFPHL